MAEIKKNGFVIINDNFLCLRFQYDKERYKYLYGLTETCYKKEEKLWYIPIRHFKKLYNSKLFSKDTIEYQINKQELELKLKKEVERKNNALKNLSKNPFSLSKEDILLTEPHIIIILSESKKFLKLIAKPRTKIKQELLKNKNITFLKEERSFFLPTMFLNILLKYLKEKKIPFAVEKETSDALIKGANLRRKLKENNYLESSKDYELAIVYPFIFKHTESNNLYEFSYSHTYQLTIAFKHIKSHAQRKKFASNFTENELEKVLYNLQSSRVKCYLTKDVYNDLEIKKKNLKHSLSSGQSELKDENLGLFLPLVCWTKEEEPMLLIKKDIYTLKLANNKTFLNLKKELHNVYKNHYIFTFNERNIEDEYKKLNIALNQAGVLNIITTKSFLELLQDLKKRKVLVDRCEYFRKLKDATINFNDKEFEAKLFPHQRVGIKWLLEFKNALLGDDMGLGKTLTVLSTFKYLREKEEIDLMLVICPNSLITNWKKEAEYWTPELWTKLITGTKSKRGKILNKILTQGVEIGIINYESARLDDITEKLIEIAKKKKILICFDESQKLKNPTSKTFKALRKIALHAQ
ncbi:MAG: SNF2-related protein, partial [Bdellovibrionota bacterium]